MLGAFVSRDVVDVTITGLGRDLKRRGTVLFYVTSLGSEQSRFTQIAHVIRARWGIENRLCWICDVVFDEDYRTTRRPNTIRLWTLLRSTVISLIHLAGLPVTATTRPATASPNARSRWSGNSTKTNRSALSPRWSGQNSARRSRWSSGLTAPPASD